MRNCTLALLVGAAALTACHDTPSTPSEALDPALAEAPSEGIVSPWLGSLNQRLAHAGKDFRISRAEYVTRADGQEAGQTVFANDRQKQLSSHFVPGDPRRGVGNTITYLVDQSDGATTTGTPLTNAQTEPALDRAMGTWEDQRCSSIPMVKLTDSGADPDLVDGLIFGIPALVGTPFADVTHAGWLGAAFFDAIAPGGSDFILAVTFTFVFIDGAGNPTDVNGDGKDDTAFAEIFYNDAFAWGINVQTDPFDVETVALHEAGHALSQGHFGKIFRTDSNGKLHFAPFAVMNAAISRQAQELRGTDNGGHCSIWGSWPN